MAQDIDDVGFFGAMIDALAAGRVIDPKNVFITGISNGSIMTHRLACEVSGRIRGFAAVSGEMAANVAPTCQPSSPLSVMLIHGTDDPIVPFEGGYVMEFDGSTRGLVTSFVDSASFWAHQERCPETPDVTFYDADPTDPTIVRSAHRACANGTDVTFLSITRGGHTWPGGPQYLRPSLVGLASRQIDATEMISQFFADHWQ
jgi:polyhydroxybutyrate depolymerase